MGGLVLSLCHLTNQNKKEKYSCLICALFTFILEWIAWLLSINRWEIKLYINDLLAQASSKQLIAEVCHKLREFGCCLLYPLSLICFKLTKSSFPTPIKLDPLPPEYPHDWTDRGFETILFIFLNTILSDCNNTETWISEMLFVLYEETNTCEWLLTMLISGINLGERL